MQEHLCDRNCNPNPSRMNGFCWSCADQIVSKFAHTMHLRGYTVNEFRNDFAPIRYDEQAIKDKLIGMSKGWLDDSNVDGACE
jgi:hypothetical protein